VIGEASGAVHDVEALVLAAGQGERLGLGPKALLTLDGQTLIDRAVEAVRAVARRVIVGVPAERLDECRALLGADVTVVAGGDTRLDTEVLLFEASSAPLLVLHDVVHPFATAELARRVLAAARERGAAMAAVATTSHVFRVESGTLSRVRQGDGLWSSRKPIAFSRSAFARGLAARARLPHDGGVTELLLAGGEHVEIVPGEPWNVKVTTMADWALAQAIAPLVKRGLLRS
jgi:2-C-methyl-D-erythritol 4-phosphate cytidylyltransferase